DADRWHEAPLPLTIETCDDIGERLCFGAERLRTSGQRGDARDHGAACKRNFIAVLSHACSRLETFRAYRMGIFRQIPRGGAFPHVPAHCRRAGASIERPGRPALQWATKINAKT